MQTVLGQRMVNGTEVEAQGWGVGGCPSAAVLSHVLFFLGFVCFVLLFNRRKMMLMYAKRFIILKRSLNAVCL